MLTEGRHLRDDGIQRVLAPEESWKDLYRELVLGWFNRRPAGHKFTGETLRKVAQWQGLPDPHHPNAWGGVSSGLIRSWLKDKKIRCIGLSNATDSKAHARRYPLYAKV